MMQEELLLILEQAGNLKRNTRHCWIDPDRKESVADHSWRLALMAMLLSGEEEFRGVDMNRVIRMCLIHDLGESFTGDIPSFEKQEEDRDKEENLFWDWVESFPSPQKEYWLALLNEMKELKTREAKTYKALDKIEALISHDESELDTWLPLEYDLQLEYGKKEAAFSPYLMNLHRAIDVWTKEKIEQKREEDSDSYRG